MIGSLKYRKSPAAIFQLELQRANQCLLDIFAYVGGLQNLVTLGMGAPAVLTEVVLRNPTWLVRPPMGGQCKFQFKCTGQTLRSAFGWLSLPTRICFSASSSPAGCVPSQNGCSSRGIIDGSSCLLLSEQYAPQMYEENAFASAISAAETFHRMRFENEIVPTAEFKSRKRKMANAVKGALGSRSRDWLNQQLTFK